MPRVVGLRGGVSIAAVLSLAVTAAVLIMALVVAADNRADGRELSARLVPAAATAGGLLNLYTTQQTSLRDYVTSGGPAARATFRRATALIPGDQDRLAALVRGYPWMPRELARVEAMHEAWLARVAGPQLAAAGRGAFGRARALQANTPFIRPYVLGLRSRVAALQVQITSKQGAVTSSLVGGQRRLLTALAAVCLVVALIVAGAVVVVRRWLLRPCTALRQAAEAVAAGCYDTPVPAAGPAELVDLGRAAELMRTRLAASLAESERAEDMFRGLFELAPDAIMIVAPDQSILMANEQAERLFGYSPDELAGQPAAALLPEAADLPARYLAGLTPHRPRGVRATTAVRKGGQEFPVETNVTALPTESGTVGVLSVHDISERIAVQAEGERLRDEAERERQAKRQAQSQRMESLGQLVGGVAHDFNNLLTVIGGYTDFIAEQAAALAQENRRAQSMLADIEHLRDGTARAVSLTRQLLTFARRDVVHPEILDLPTVINRVEHLLRRTLGEHIDLVINTTAGLWPVKADPGQLEQVLVNLAVNARDAMPGGGKLVIDTANVTADQAYTATHPGLGPGRYIRLRVSDTGTGMDVAVAARVFEPFFTTKPKGEGTGLGLATVYGILTQAGGQVQIYSEPGMGTTVTALLPATQDAPAARPSETAAPPRGRAETILLIEDEQALWRLASRILTGNGYRICAAATPDQALRLASELGQPIDLLLTDAIMPSMLGNQVAALLSAIRPELPVLYMSGYAQPVLDSQGALDTGAELLEKPFSEATLLTRVRQAIDGPRQPSGG